MRTKYIVKEIKIMKYKDWLSEWLEYYVKPRAKFRTQAIYTQQINKHIIPYLGEYELNELTVGTLQRFIVDLMEIGLSSNTVNGIINILSNSLQTAVNLEKIEKNYMELIQRPKSREKQVECFNKEEQRKIERYIIDNKKFSLYGIVICLYTGLRIGELLALTWDDIDMKNSIMSITKTCRDTWECGKYVKVLDSTKTEGSERLIPFPKQLIPLLKELKKEAKGEFVVYGRTDQGAQIRSYQRTFENLLIKLEISHKGFHSLRHTFATRATECGVDVKTLSEILGHKNPTITLKRYAHSLFSHKIDMMNKVGKSLV